MSSLAWRGVGRALVVASLASAAFLGCNVVFGIEEQPLRSGPEDASAEDVGSGKPSFEPCARDQDCAPPNGCLTPHCDTVLGACTYALCEAKDRTCAMGTCDTATFACSEPQSYGFHSTSYDVPALTLGCAPTPERCVASVFPFVFVGTRDDVAAVRADDLVGTTATRVGVTGVGTKPAQLVASGRRLWVIGALQGQAPPYGLPVAVMDVPSDPTATTLVAHTSLIPYPFPSAIGFSAPNGALFLSHNDPAQGFPTALVSAPIPSGASFGAANAEGAGVFDASAPEITGSLTMYRTAMAPAGGTIVAASGSRLIASRSSERLSFIAGAGTPGASMQPEQALKPPFAPIGPVHIAQGPDGVVAINAPILADGQAGCDCRSVERLQWLFPNSVATTADANQSVDHAVYVNPQAAGGACHVCTGDYVRLPSLAAWLDRRTMLVASADEATRTVADVRVIGRDPLDANPKRRAKTKATDTPSGNFATDSIALTASNGIGYLIRADSQGNDVLLSIFDPRCDAR